MAVVILERNYCYIAAVVAMLDSSDSDSKGSFIITAQPVQPSQAMNFSISTVQYPCLTSRWPKPLNHRCVQHCMAYNGSTISVCVRLTTGA